MGKWRDKPAKTLIDAARAILPELSGEEAELVESILHVPSPSPEQAYELRMILSSRAGALARLGFVYSELSL